MVSTHSRLKAAGPSVRVQNTPYSVSTHSRLKAAGPPEIEREVLQTVSTHSRLKAAGQCCFLQHGSGACFNTQPPEGGWAQILFEQPGKSRFQHTAA